MHPVSHDSSSFLPIKGEAELSAAKTRRNVVRGGCLLAWGGQGGAWYVLIGVLGINAIPLAGQIVCIALLAISFLITAYIWWNAEDRPGKYAIQARALPSSPAMTRKAAQILGMPYQTSERPAQEIHPAGCGKELAAQSMTEKGTENPSSIELIPFQKEYPPLIPIGMLDDFDAMHAFVSEHLKKSITAAPPEPGKIVSQKKRRVTREIYLEENAALINRIVRLRRTLQRISK